MKVSVIQLFQTSQLFLQNEGKNCNHKCVFFPSALRRKWLSKRRNISVHNFFPIRFLRIQKRTFPKFKTNFLFKFQFFILVALFAVAAADSYKAAEYKTPKYEAPKYEAPKYETPKYEAPKYETPKYETPKYETPKYESPKYEAPKYETPKYEAPKYEAPKYETPKYEAPKYEEVTYVSYN